jgi:hypothetical protein
MKRIAFVVGLVVLVFAVATIAQTPDQPPVELNHVYVTLQKNTIDAIAKSKFIAEQFARFRQASTKTVDASWTGTYLTGWRAYLELFAPGGAEKNLGEGSSGIGFSTLRIGSGKVIHSNLETLLGEKVVSSLEKLGSDQKSFPWFDNIHLQSLGQGSFQAWLMDFRPEFIKLAQIKLTNDGLFDRHEYNDSGNSDPEQKKAFASKLFDDLSEVHLELTATESSSFDKFVTALGFVPSKSRAARSFHAGNFTFFVTTRPNPAYRIRKVVCTLRRTVDPRAEYRFGPDARLIVEGHTAIWMFGKD